MDAESEEEEPMDWEFDIEPKPEPMEQELEPEDDSEGESVDAESEPDSMDSEPELSDDSTEQAQERTATIAQAVEATAGATVNGNQANQGQAPVVVNRLMHQLVEQFLKLKPLKFDGKGDPEAAPCWVEELEKAFEATRGRVFPEGVAQTWVVFSENFYGKFFSESARERKLAEFIRLRQGQMTVDQYEAKFARLSKFAPMMVENPEDKAQRFRDGLKVDIRTQLIPVNLRTYEDLYKRAQAIKRDQVDRVAASRSRAQKSMRNIWQKYYEP
ncbi:uncharacterized protein LOC130136285 [Syzygium oleosum]|uniref:uncharacterized protein LOC130136285 n=1 Tax=Syzygium oleosum TaxID=219896 RepID=UPI0024BB22E4|nr:uncharacterized protein LOC130136285 [Syzygium oleosum]